MQQVLFREPQFLRFDSFRSVLHLVSPSLRVAFVHLKHALFRSLPQQDSHRDISFLLHQGGNRLITRRVQQLFVPLLRLADEEV